MRRTHLQHDCVRVVWVVLASACTSVPSPVVDAGAPGDDGHPSDSDAPSAPADARVLVDARVPADASEAIDGGPSLLHGCAAFEDRRAEGADRTVRFDSSPSLAYTPPCILVAPGQLVAFEGPFVRHALAPGRSPLRTGEPLGSPDNPIPSVAAGTRAEATFPLAGIFPFHCPTHDLAGMVGVVRVE